MKKQSFLIAIEKGVRKCRPIEDDALALLLELGEAVEVGPCVYEKVNSKAAPQEKVAALEPESNDYQTKVMVPEVKRSRGRPRKVAQ